MDSSSNGKSTSKSYFIGTALYAWAKTQAAHSNPSGTRGSVNTQITLANEAFKECRVFRG